MMVQSEKYFAEDSRASIDEGNIDLRRLFAELGVHYGIMAQEKKQFLEIYLSPEVPRYCWGNAEELYDLVSLLLRKSLSGISKGGITLHVIAKFLGNNDPFLLEIIISQNTHQKFHYQETLFSKFCGDLSLEKEYNDPTLNLTHVKELVCMLGGDFSVQRLGGGLARYTLIVTLQTNPSIYSVREDVMNKENNVSYLNSIGVFYVSNLPHGVSDEKIRKFFMNMGNVLSVAVHDEEIKESEPRCCWVELKQPFAFTVNEMVTTSFEGNDLSVKFMGHLLPEGVPQAYQ